MIRIATFNLENLTDAPNSRPPLEVRLPYLRSALARLRADVLCLQEVHAEATPDGGVKLPALDELVDGTQYATFSRASTGIAGVPDKDRSLVVLSRLPIRSSRSVRHDLLPQAPLYRVVTAEPPATDVQPIQFERPLLHCEIEIGDGRLLQVVAVHLKSRLPTSIKGQGPHEYQWHTAAGWAEGSFLSSMQRVGQALELRMLIDSFFAAEPNALIAVAGDFNSDAGEVPLQAVQGRVEDTGNPNLGLQVLVPCENTVPEPARFTLLHQGKPTMLDHIVVSRPLLQHYRATEIHNETLHDESVAFATDVLYPESDHAPIVAEFEL